MEVIMHNVGSKIAEFTSNETILNIAQEYINDLRKNYV
jgi:hypothetical protein